MYQCECLGMFWRKVWSVVEIESEIFQLFRSEILLLITHGVYGHFFGGLFVNSKADSKKVLSTSCKYPSCHPCFDTKEISVELKRLNQAWYLHKAWLPSLCRTLFGSGGLHASGFGTWYGLTSSVGLLGCDLIFWLIRLSSWKDLASSCGSVSIFALRYRVFCWMPPWWAMRPLISGKKNDL